MDNEECKMQGSFEGSGYFLKVMPADFAQKLCIPTAFVSKLRQENCENMIFQGPSGKRWVVKLSGTETQLEFRHGWDKFVRDHAIASGDFLVFKYVCRSYFKVRIFGRNGCEKNIISSAKFHKRCRYSASASLLRVASDSDDYAQTAAQKGKNLKFPSDDHLPNDSRRCQPFVVGKKRDTVKSAKAERTSCGNLKHNYVSGRLNTEAIRNNAVKAANSFTSDKPFCLIVLKPSNLNNWINLPKPFEDHLKLPKERSKVILVDPNTKEWNVQYIWCRSTGVGGLSAGWKRFLLDNNLEEGDTCIFERVDKGKSSIKLRVHIFRVTKNSTSYKKREGGRTSDSSALPATLSIKKMKVSRGNLATNLLAKDFRPEQGKRKTKQGIEVVEGQKEKASTRSNQFKLSQSKCTPAISEKKAGCRRSLRFAERCNLVKPSKKRQLRPLPSLDGQEPIRSDIVMLSEENTSLVYEIVEEDDLMIILDISDEIHAMPCRSGALSPSQEPIPEGPLTTNSICPEINPTGEVSSLAMELSPEEAAS